MKDDDETVEGLVELAAMRKLYNPEYDAEAFVAKRLRELLLSGRMVALAVKPEGTTIH